MTIKKTFVTIACLAIINFCVDASNARAEVDMNEGQWEVTITTELAKIPFVIPPTVDTMCLSKSELIPKDEERERDDNCKIAKQDISGDTVSWEIVCDADTGQMTGSGSITYAGDNFDGTVKIQVPSTGTVIQTMTGKRIGNCN